jgi:hypothetical protein
MENNNKIESPDYQMDISENISQTSISSTSNHETSDKSEVKKSRELEEISISMNSVNLNGTATKSRELENIENRNTLNLDPVEQQHNPQKLTPVRNHPLMFDDDDSEDSYNNSKAISNFPDVVLSTTASHIQPTTKSKISSTDLVNSVNNNDGRNRIPKYREPSPVSIFKFNALCGLGKLPGC